ncbi:MAG: hypothetical protein GW836_00760 [Paraglaciecola sp.]|nr:hypothetical protein [Paraglaciecola sp.]
MNVLIVLLLVIVIILFCYTIYKLEKTHINDRGQWLVEITKSKNVISIGDPLNERLKSNLELFLQAEDALVRDDSIEYITLKSKAINHANKLLGKDLKGAINNGAAR